MRIDVIKFTVLGAHVSLELDGKPWTAGEVVIGIRWNKTHSRRHVRVISGPIKLHLSFKRRKEEPGKPDPQLPLEPQS